MIEPSSDGIAATIEALRRAPDLIVPLVRQVPRDVRKRRPEPGKWSAHEHACHLPAVQPIMMKRLEHMLTSPNPVIRPYNPSDDDRDGALLKVDLDEAMDRFARERAEMVRRLRDLSPELWAIRAEHAEYAEYSVFIMFRHVALHDFYHAYRIEERLLQRSW